MKKIIGFFKVLFHIQGIIDRINVNLLTLSENQQQNWNEHSVYNDNLCYLEKFALILKDKPIYEIGQTVFFNVNNSNERPTEENKLQGKITGVITHPLFEYSKAIISQVDYEYLYQIRTEGRMPVYYRIPESKIIM